MPCYSTKTKIKGLVKNTLLSEQQISDAFRIFVKFSSSKEYLTFEEFKRSLGLLGSVKNDFIIRRIFDIALESSGTKLSFEKYANYLNFLNNSTINDRMRFCFNIFDIHNEGIITCESYKTTMIAFYEYYAELVDVPKRSLESTLDQIFKKIEQKSKVTSLDFTAFIKEMRENLEFSDFFDILNDRTTKEQKAYISLDKVDELEYVKELVQEVNIRLNSYAKSFEQEEKPKISNFSFSIGTKAWKENNNVNFSNKEAFNDLPSFLMTEEDSQSCSENSKEDFISIDCSSFLTINQKNQLRAIGIDPDDCLIISDRKKMLKKLETIERSIKFITDGLCKNRNSRREGFQMKQFSAKEVQIEDYEKFGFKFCRSKNLVNLGNENVEMALTMMTGISKAVNSLPDTNHVFEVQPDSNIDHERNEFNFVKSAFGSEISCKFVDLAPKLFFNLRKLYGISNKDYLKSLGTENFISNLVFPRDKSLKGLGSFGKSGSFFFFSYDNKFVIKTISDDEFTFFQKIVKNYYLYMQDSPDTALQRFFGLHLLTYAGKTIPFIVMNFIFCSDFDVDIKYDLKGSSYKRLSRKGKDYEDYDYAVPLKDLDFIERKEKIELESESATRLIGQLKRDADFLFSQGINDYSLLIGIHDFSSENGNNFISTLLQKSKTQKENKKRNFIERNPFFESYCGGIQSSDKMRLYFFGIIDPLTHYG